MSPLEPSRINEGEKRRCHCYFLIAVSKVRDKSFFICESTIVWGCEPSIFVLIIDAVKIKPHTLSKKSSLNYRNVSLRINCLENDKKARSNHFGIPRVIGKLELRKNFTFCLFFALKNKLFPSRLLKSTLRLLRATLRLGEAMK